MKRQGEPETVFHHTCHLEHGQPQEAHGGGAALLLRLLLPRAAGRRVGREAAGRPLQLPPPPGMRPERGEVVEAAGQRDGPVEPQVEPSVAQRLRAHPSVVREGEGGLQGEGGREELARSISSYDWTL